MKLFPILSFAGIVFIFFTCKNSPNQNLYSFDALNEIPTHCQVGGEPNLFVSQSGEVFLSWVEYLNDSTDALLFSKLKDGKWTSPKTIASGSNWFVNWADFPSLVASKDGKNLAAHWLQKSAEGTYDYDVRIAQSEDGGTNWSPSFIPHRDSISAEHGFVSMLPYNDSKTFATWLDGRNTKGEGHDEDAHDHGHHGAMSLRAAIFDKKGKLSDEVELDNRICDCCQTSAAKTDDGIVIVYRDRSEKEIRDISIVRQVNGEWTEPKTIYNDNWMIAGCPVNGPSIDVYGKNVAVAWFTMKEEKGEVKVAFSNDGGANFGTPIRVDDGKPLGRVDIVMISEEEVIVSWIEEKETGAAIKITSINQEGKMSEKFKIADSKATRKSGFPRMVKCKNQIILAWTNVDSLTNVKTAVLDFKK